MRKVDNPECKIISLIVDADTERCVCTARLDMCVEITHFSRRCGSVRKLQLHASHVKITCYLHDMKFSRESSRGISLVFI